MSRLTPLLLLLAACGGPPDADYDGSPDEADCDDADGLIYPGAPDDPMDGVDSDCDGVDPAWGFVGTWPVTEVQATYSSFQFLEEGSASGELTITEELTSVFTLDADLDEALYGTPIPFSLLLEGDASPVDGPDTFVVRADGEQYDETMHIDWDCARFVDAGELICEGELKAFDLSLDVYAAFEG